MRQDTENLKSTAEAGQLERRVIQQENEANYFAMCLLMPEALIRNHIDKTGNDLETEDDVLRLSSAFQVSQQLMLARLIGIGLIAMYNA